MFQTKTVTASAELKADSEGSISAVFSTFDVIDQQGDVVVREAFTDGQSVPMVWAHDWARVIGKGTVKTDPKRAIFDGRFFMDTTEGADAYRTVKAMGDLQEYSWGFQILDAAEEVRDGTPVRVITKAELFEVSPVLVGANRETYTLAIKGKRRISRGQLEAVITTLQALLGDDEAEELTEGAAETPPADDGKAADPPEPPSLDVLGAKLADDLVAYVARLCSATADAPAATKGHADALLRRLSSARIDLDAVLKRAEQASIGNPHELLTAFRRIDGLYGPIHSGRQAG